MSVPSTLARGARVAFVVWACGACVGMDASVAWGDTLTPEAFDAAVAREVKRLIRRPHTATDDARALLRRLQLAIP